MGAMRTPPPIRGIPNQVRFGRKLSPSPCFTKFPDDMSRSLFTGKSGGGCPILMISYIDRRVYPCREPFI